LAKVGLEVIVANPRQIPLITESDRKNDRVDAELLARLGRLDPKLLRPIVHRGPQARRSQPEPQQEPHPQSSRLPVSLSPRLLLSHPRV
jgi:transposase